MKPAQAEQASAATSDFTAGVSGARPPVVMQEKPAPRSGGGWIAPVIALGGLAAACVAALAFSGFFAAVDEVGQAEQVGRSVAWQEMAKDGLEVEALPDDKISVTVWDDLAEDGDVIELVSNGHRQVVHLYNSMQTFTLPRPESGAITIHGVKDGGGGITLGVIGNGKAAFSPVFAPGSDIAVPVR